MKKTIALMLLGLWSGLNAGTPLLVEDFSGLPQGVNLTNQTWWGPNWNSGDVVYTRVNPDGPGGVPAITRTQEVFAGRFYGGGLRDLRRPLPAAISGDVDPADVQVSFWLKGTSTASRGAIGFSLISFDTTVSPVVETGAAYYKVIITPEQWTEISFTMADMEAGIIGHGTAGKPFDFANSNEWQVFIWTRNDFEQGWVIQDENHKWSFSVAALSITLEGEQPPPTEWAGLPIVDGWVDTGAMLGWVNVEQAPWVYAYELGNYIYLPEEFVSEAGGWAYILR